MIRLVAIGVLALALTACGSPPPVPVPAVTLAPTPVVDAPVAAPERLRIPAIGVDSPFVDLGLDAAGALLAPDSTDVVGWFAAGPAPGADGPALVAGHVDSRSGPAVFYRLRELRAGDRVEVLRTDGSTVAFTVTSRTDTPKATFPTEQVYGPTPGPELRLVTCGGTFDRSTGHYRDNVVVEAVAADPAGWTIG